MAVHPFQNFMVRYGAGERIFTEGDLGTTMYIVQSGKVRMFRMVEAQKRVHGVMEKGDFFGEMSILEGLPRTLSAEAVEDSELIEINSMTFDNMIKGNIEIAIRMLRKLSIRLRESEGWGGMTSFYSNAWTRSISPEVRTTQNLHGDTRLFDAQLSEVIWSAATTTATGWDTVPQMISQFSRLIVDTLKKDGVI